MTREEFQQTISKRFSNTESGFGNMTQRERILLQIASNEYEKQVKNPDVVKSLPNDDEIEQAAREEATRIFDGTGSGSEWYARHHGFTDGVEWLKNHLTKLERGHAMKIGKCDVKVL